MTDPEGPARYQHLSFNAPLSEARADAIARRLAAAQPMDVLDLGCGWGELLLRVLERAPSAAGTGVDSDAHALDRGREAARRRGLADRVSFTCAAADRISSEADLVICVGASHAWGGTEQALTALLRLIRPGGRLLFGDGLWNPRAEVPEPGLVWEDMLALPDLARLIDLAVTTGYRPLYAETSTTDELDAFESGFLADDEEWLMTHAEHPRASEVRARADEHRRRWLHGYRHGFGFAYLTLGRPTG